MWKTDRAPTTSSARGMFFSRMESYTTSFIYDFPQVQYPYVQIFRVWLLVKLRAVDQNKRSVEVKSVSDVKSVSVKPICRMCQNNSIAWISREMKRSSEATFIPPPAVAVRGQHLAGTGLINRKQSLSLRLRCWLSCVQDYVIYLEAAQSHLRQCYPISHIGIIFLGDRFRDMHRDEVFPPPESAECI